MDKKIFQLWQLFFDCAVIKLRYFQIIDTNNNLFTFDFATLQIIGIRAKSVNNTKYKMSIYFDLSSKTGIFLFIDESRLREWIGATRMDLMPP